MAESDEDRKGRLVLFLCTGNYYRSRYAEIRFNAIVETERLPWRAVSRGLAPSALNVGPMSPHTVEALTRLGIDHARQLRSPIAVTCTDFAEAHIVIALKTAEHRAMIQQDFPDFLERVEFWDVHDLDCAAPQETLADIERRLAQLIDRLRARATAA